MTLALFPRFLSQLQCISLTLRKHDLTCFLVFPEFTVSLLTVVMPSQSFSKVSFAKTTLPFPIFAAEFDPYSRGYLVVGGGGGESKSGVPNQIVRTESLQGGQSLTFQ